MSEAAVSVLAVPKSKGRKPKKSPRRVDAPGRVDPAARHSGRYAAGRLEMSDERIGALLSGETIEPDLMVELLLPALWLSHMTGQPANHCVDGSMTLHYAYKEFGITADPRAVDLAVNDRSRQTILYGQPNPHWEGSTFHGHCILWLPETRRVIDATVEQYPEVRRYRLGPICGRLVMMQGTDAAQEAMMQRGELPPGAHIGIQREGITLLYTAVDATYHDVVTEYSLVQDTAPRYRRAGINLASHALTLLRIPEVIDRVRQAPYPRLRALLDAIGDAEVEFDDQDDWRFVLPGFDGQRRSLRLDEIPLAATPPPARTGRHNSSIPARPQADSATVQDVLSSVDTAARAAFIADDLSLGESGVPAVLFEPMQAVAGTSPNGQTSELQAEMIIAAGFTRFLPDLDRAPQHLPDWSLRRTDTGLELWDAGGIWARGALNLDDGWLTAAEQHSVVVVIYGAQIGVRAPREISSYTDGHRHTELMESRRAGIVAAATIAWPATCEPAAGLLSRALRRIMPR